ncbi:hypothetical protein [Streptomyces sp. NPDC055107]
MTITLPIPVVVTRHKCPFCGTTRAKKQAAFAHIGRCWHNPDARSCKTCHHFTPAASDGPYPEHPGWPEACEDGQDITAGLPVGCPQWAPPEGNR